MIKEHWEKLDDREKVLVGAMSVFVVIAIIYWGIWQPLANKQETLKHNLTQQIELNQWAQNSIAKIKAAGTTSRNSNTGSLSQIVNRTTSGYGFTISRMQPREDKLQLWIEEASFDELVSWLAQLESRHQVKVNQFDVSAADQAGIVKVRRLELIKA
ncbi:type II secretion system protein GspM [Flocculibacter collagenilyticus]|uniref:type II secretion system protein GspM n=1 Tax=Flocculibacter collagenilyticus TaxID=2744479 RepID=UPI0018F44B54|nr:type II secretion system protein M [Flocculibacter collagenilyticus]